MYLKRLNTIENLINDGFDFYKYSTTKANHTKFNTILDNGLNIIDNSVLKYRITMEKRYGGSALEKNKEIVEGITTAMVSEIVKVGDKVKGKVVVLADYGAFVEIAPGVEGLIHVSEMSWSTHLRSAGDFVKVGDEVEAEVLTLDREDRKISLGIKQLNSDPFNDFLAANERGALVKGTVTAVDARGATVKLADEVEATLKASEINRDRVEDATKFLEVGQEVEAKIINVDRKSRSIN